MRTSHNQPSDSPSSFSKSSLPRLQAISSEDLLKMKDSDLSVELETLNSRNQRSAIRTAAHLLTLKMRSPKDMPAIGIHSLEAIGKILQKTFPAASFNAYAIAQKAEPENPVHLTGMAAALIKLGKLEQAWKISKALTRRWPKSGMSKKTAVKVMLALGKEGEALSLCDKWLQSDVENKTAWRLKAGVLLGSKRYPEAVLFCRAAHKKFPAARRFAEMLRNAEKLAGRDNGKPANPE